MRTLLYIIRGLFVLTCAGAGLVAARAVAEKDPASFFSDSFMMAIIAMAVGLAAIVADVMVGRRSPATLGGIFIGIIVGGVLTPLALYALATLFPDFSDADYGPAARALTWVVLTYLSVSIILQTKDNFRFVIPYVEFHRETRGERPLLLDTSAVIDGRIADLAATGIIEDPLVIPSFVLMELQAVADSSVRERRMRGRRGLDILSKLRAGNSIEVKILECDEGNEPVDQRLVKLAQTLDGRILTTDFNLNKLAEVHGVEVVNLNEMANALRPVVLPGETVKVAIVKPGEQGDQGVGFLEDGTMVVVEGGRSRMGKTVTVAVTNVRQTSVGRMFFGKIEG